MLFGNKKVFAIEAILNQSDRFAFISYCFWIKEEIRIGDIQQPSLLSGQIPVIQNILLQKGKRSIDYIEQLGYHSKSLLDFFIETVWEGKLIFDNHSFSINNLKLFDINSQSGECFTGYFVFLVEYKSYDLLLCRDDVEKKDYQLKVPKYVFYKEVENLLSWIINVTFIKIIPDALG